MKGFCSFALVLSFTFIALAGASPQTQCSILDSECDKDSPCCDGLACERDFTNSEMYIHKCKSRWSTNKTRGSRVGAEQFKIGNAFLQSVFGVGSAGPCIDEGGNCALTPHGCCPPFTCQGDKFNFWTCKPAPPPA